MARPALRRHPVEARLVGTRRYAPGRRFEEVRTEIETLCRQVEAETGARVDLTLTKGRDGFLVDERALVVGTRVMATLAANFLAAGPATE